MYSEMRALFTNLNRSDFHKSKKFIPDAHPLKMNVNVHLKKNIYGHLIHVEQILVVALSNTII